MNKLLMTAALIAGVSPAMGESFVATSRCTFSRYYGYSDCQAISTYVPDPVRDVEQERLDAIERRMEDAKWVEFCKPKFRADAYGVRRASYTKSGCEFGRSE